MVFEHGDTEEHITLCLRVQNMPYLSLQMSDEPKISRLEGVPKCKGSDL